MTSARNILIGITIGDINGIGPEIVLKVLDEIDLSKSTPVIIAPENVITFYANEVFSSGIGKFHFIEEIDSSKPDEINVLSFPSFADPEPGKLTSKSGKTAMLSIEKGIDLAKCRKIDALVTAPISKEAVNLAGYKIPGHTEFLAEKTDTKTVLMMLVNQNFRMALVTGHIPVSKVAESINEHEIIRKAEILQQSLNHDFLIDAPKIAVLGLNPHAGDGGIIGKEEIEIISPAIHKLQKQGIQAYGPFPTDGFFGNKMHEKYDGILAMYHDQGLAPFKLLSFGKGVNFTAGLPIIRTSPDHGTAFDIAGNGLANPASFKEAYNLAVELAKNRKSDSRR